MKKYRVKLNGKEYEVDIEEITNQTELQEFPKTSPVPQSAPRHSSNKGETVVAPMPGILLDIKVAVGEQVKKGQVLAILEAMKMENELVAPVDGVVASLSVTKGQTVEAGVTLLHID